jgi:hypothetical protein
MYNDKHTKYKYGLLLYFTLHTKREREKKIKRNNVNPKSSKYKELETHEKQKRFITMINKYTRK